MSSIEWLEQQFINLMSFDTVDFRKEFRDKIQQAKEMHRKEIENAFDEGVYEIVFDAEDYYNATFTDTNKQL